MKVKSVHLAGLCLILAPLLCAAGVTDGKVAELFALAAQSNWEKAEKASARLLATHEAALGLRVTNDLPLGSVLQYHRGMALRRGVVSEHGARKKVERAVKALHALRNAAAWLNKARGQGAASGAWADVYYELGQTQKTLGRFGDAEDFLDASAMYCAKNSRAFLKTQLALASLEMRRSWYKPAYVRMTNIWWRLDNPSKQTHHMYAKALLSQRKDNEACEVMLAGLSWYGVSPKLVDKDPLFRLFLHDMGRASDDQISRFYDILGLQLGTMKMTRGCEELAALLINQRNMLSRCHMFLKKERDLERLRKRCRFRTDEEGEWESIHELDEDEEMDEL